MTLELGTTSLSQARLARGLTLEDAERSTRISRRFLIALEEHDYSVFPAPVYARGFLRTYCRYLGIDPEEQLAELPSGWAATAPSTTHLPPVSRGPMTFNFAWIIAGAAVVLMVGLGLFLSRGGNDLGQLENQGALLAQEQQQEGSQAQNSPEGAAGTSGAVSTEPTEVAGRSLEAGLPGTLPDFEDVAVAEVLSFLNQQGISYLRIDTASNAPAGLVIGQTPDAGASTEGLAQVTLTVSAGGSVGAARTDCSVLESTNRRTQAEQAYFEQNCGEAATAGDRTDCEEIRGTDYRSPEERQFFLTNCVVQ